MTEAVSDGVDDADAVALAVRDSEAVLLRVIDSEGEPLEVELGERVADALCVNDAVTEAL